MPRYDFYLRSGKTVRIEMDNLPALIDQLNKLLVAGVSDDDREWFADQGFRHCVRWSEVAGWSLVVDESCTVYGCTTHRPRANAYDPAHPDHVTEEKE